MATGVEDSHCKPSSFSLPLSRPLCWPFVLLLLSIFLSSFSPSTSEVSSRSPSVASQAVPPFVCLCRHCFVSFPSFFPRELSEKTAGIEEEYFSRLWFLSVNEGWTSIQLSFIFFLFLFFFSMDYTDWFCLSRRRQSFLSSLERLSMMESESIFEWKKRKRTKLALRPFLSVVFHFFLFFFLLYSRPNRWWTFFLLLRLFLHFSRSARTNDIRYIRLLQCLSFLRMVQDRRDDWEIYSYSPEIGGEGVCTPQMIMPCWGVEEGVFVCPVFLFFFCLSLIICWWIEFK